MLCPKCGNEINANWKVCPNCGTPIQSNNQVNQSKYEFEDDYTKGYVDDNLESNTRPIYQQNTAVHTESDYKISIRAKLWGWLFSIFNIIFGILMFKKSIVGAILLLLTVIFFCPYLWKKTRRKAIWIILGSILYVAGWIMILNSPESNSSADNEFSKVQSGDNSDYNAETADMDEENTDTSSDDSDEETTEYYPTDKVDTGVWDVTIWNSWVSHDDVFDENDVNCYCTIVNNSDTNQTFNATDLFQMDNGGILGEASCDYDGRTFTAGTKLQTTVVFSFPESLNNSIDSMSVSAGNKIINLAAKPQKSEAYDSLEGTYEQSGMKLVFVKLSDSSYQLYDYNPTTGLEISTISVKDNQFAIGKAGYIYLPDEHMIYASEEGEADKDNFAGFVKKNKLIFDTGPLDEVEKGDIYYAGGDVVAAITHKGNEGSLIVYTRESTDKASVEYKGTFDYKAAQEKLTDIELTFVADYNKEYVTNEKIVFKSSDSLILTPDTEENGMEYVKE